MIVPLLQLRRNMTTNPSPSTKITTSFDQTNSRAWLKTPFNSLPILLFILFHRLTEQTRSSLTAAQVTGALPGSHQYRAYFPGFPPVESVLAEGSGVA